jgi:hypothetical protein
MTNTEQIEWEKEFDEEYKDEPMEVWTVGILAQALTHGKENKWKDASHITVKLRKLIEKDRASQRQQILDAVEKDRLSFIKDGNYDNHSYEQGYLDATYNAKEVIKEL